MAEVKLYTWEGKEAGLIPLSDALFAVEPKAEVVHQAVTAQDANSRAISAHVKDRSEVRGGGKKPWKQKGTGRARHGSTRSPIWVGGGVAHGPTKDRNFSVKLNKKAKRLALAMVLTDKLREGKFIAVEDFNIPEAKTKHANTMRGALPGSDKRALVLVVTGDSKMKRAVQNLPKTETMHAHSLNVRDLVKANYVIASKDAIAMIVETFTS